MSNSSNQNDNVDVLFEDNHLLVLNKPPLLATMGVQEGEDSLYRWAQQYVKEKYNKPGNVYIGVISRLDSFVSGAIVLARTSKAASRLSDQMRRGVIEKRYVALIPAGLNPPEGRLTDRMIKNESRHRMEALPVGASSVEGEKIATLTYRTLLEQAGLQALEINLETGRKHQIRVQLENAGFSIVGDRKYGSQRKFPWGIALHCFHLSFEHPTLRTVQSVYVPPPDWWPIQPLKNREIPRPDLSQE